MSRTSAGRGWTSPRPVGATRAGARCSAASPRFFYHVHSYHPAGLSPTRTCSAPASTATSFPRSWARQRDRGAVSPGEVAAGRDRAARRLRPVAPVTSVRVSLLDLYVLRGAGARSSASCCAGRPADAAPVRGRPCTGISSRASAGGRGPAGAAGRDRADPAADVQPEPGRAVLSAPAGRGRPGAGVRRLRRAGDRGDAQRRARPVGVAARRGGDAAARLAAGAPRAGRRGVLLGGGRAGPVEDVLRVC